MEHVEYVYTFGMDRDRLEHRLDENEVGVLSLARESVAYAVPVAYHYEDGSVYLRLAFEGKSTKRAYLEATAKACLCLYGVESDDESWSILVRGPLRELSDSETFDTATINELFDKLHVFDQDIEAIDIQVYELLVESITGRTTGSHSNQ